MGFWDSFKQGLGNLYNKAADAVGRLKNTVSGAVQNVRDWWNDYVTPGAGRLADAAEGALSNASQAVQRAVQRSMAASQRIQRAMEQANDTWRANLVKQYAEEQKRALALQQEAMQQSTAVAQRIREQASQVAQMKERATEIAKQELEKARQIPAQAETVLEELNRRALEEMVEKKDMLVDLSNRAQHTLDEFAKAVNPRFKEGHGGEKIIVRPEWKKFGVFGTPDPAMGLFAMGMVDVPAIAGLGGRAGGEAERFAASRIRQVLQKKGLSEMIKAFKKDPKRYIRLIGQMEPEDKAQFLANLGNVPGGKSILRAFENQEVAEITKALAAEGRRGLVQTIKSSPRWFKALLGLGAGMLSTEFVTGWLRKETTETLSINSWGAYDDKKWRMLKEITDVQRQFLKRANNEWVAKVIEAFPVLGPMFKVNREEQVASNEFYARAAEENMKNNPEPTSTIILTVSPPDANVYVNGQFRGKGPYFELDLAPGTYTILVSLKGYVAQSLTVTLTHEEVERRQVTLQPAPTQTYRKWDTATQAVKEKIRIYNPRAWNYWNSAPTANKTYYQRNWTKPRSTWNTEQLSYWKPFEADLEETGTITIYSNIAADIFIGGVDTGRTTPASFTLAPGTYDIRLQTPGYTDWIGKVFLTKGEDEEIRAELLQRAKTEREETRGYVSIVTDPLGAWVFIDGVVSDYPTPTKLELEPGRYTIKLGKKGYEDLEFPVDVDAGETIRIDEALTKAEGTGVYRVFVNSTPSGGKILVDGYFSGSWTDGYVDLLPGTYTISVQKSGYDEASQSVEVGL